jgi:hypothetical protein
MAGIIQTVSDLFDNAYSLIRLQLTKYSKGNAHLPSELLMEHVVYQAREL